MQSSIYQLIHVQYFSRSNIHTGPFGIAMIIAQFPQVPCFHKKQDEIYAKVRFNLLSLKKGLKCFSLCSFESLIPVVCVSHWLEIREDDLQHHWWHKKQLASLKLVPGKMLKAANNVHFLHRLEKIIDDSSHRIVSSQFIILCFVMIFRH